MVAPETDLDAARITAERILCAVREAPFETTEGKPRAATVSAGVAALISGDDAGALFGRADRALYEAKRAGKDRVAQLAA